MRDVELVEVDRDSKPLRTLFADHMRAQPSGRGIALVLHDGVHVRHGIKAPFLEGVYRIFLPDADADAWREAGIPGL